jgi:hypothetical protein
MQTMRTAVAGKPLRSLITGERLFALLIVAMGVIWTLDGFGYGFIDPNGGVIGAGFVPVISGIPMVVLGLAAFRQTFTGHNVDEGPAQPALADPALIVDQASEITAATDENAEGMPPLSRWAPLLLFAGMAAALLLTSWLGMIPALGLMVFAALTVIERQNVLRSAVIAAAIGFGSWLVFVHFLSVPVPFGVFGQG